MKTVLFCAPYMVPARERFQALFDHYGIQLIVPAVEERLEPEQILAYAGLFDGVIGGDDRFNAAVLEACAPRLKVIAKWGTGIDSIDREAAARLGIQVRNTPNAFTLPVADTVFGYMLAFARRQPWMDRAVKSGVWGKIPGFSLSEQTLGVIGVGNIGKAVIRRAQAFGMRILATDIVPVASDFLAETRIEMLPLEPLLQQADYVTLHCDLNPTSRKLMNDHTFSLMKPSAVLINTSRGPVVDEAALVRALQNGTIAGAGLDVFEQEPLSADSPLMKLDNAMLGSHNANSSPAAWERVHANTIRNLLLGLDIAIDDLQEVYPWR